MKLWTILALIIHYVRCVEENLVSWAQQVKHLNSPVRDIPIVCIGPLPETVRADPQLGLLYRTLASWCTDRALTDVGCDSRSYPQLTFDRLLALEWKVMAINTEFKSYSRPYSDRPYQTLQHGVEYCRIKCHCALQSNIRMTESQALAMPTGVLSVDWHLMWDFDNRRSRRVFQSRGALTSDKIGTLEFAARAQRKSFGALAEHAIKPQHHPGSEAKDFAVQHYIGDPVNAPICSPNPVPLYMTEALIRHFELLSGAARFPAIPSWKSAVELCLHEYYGGSKIASLGMICITNLEDVLVLSAPAHRRSPMLTNDFLSKQERQALGSIGPTLVETFCTMRCRCRAKKRKTPIDLDRTNSLELFEEENRKKKFLHYDYSKDILPSKPRSSSSDSDNSIYHPIMGQQCKGSCNDQSDCASVEGCNTCRVVEKMLPASLAGSAKFTARCMFSGAALSTRLRPIGGSSNLYRREIGWENACPCNSSYVSVACCTASGGEVREPSHLKMGVLV